MRNNHFRENFRVTALASIFSLIGLSFSCLASFAQTAIGPDTTLPVNTLVNFNNTNNTYRITGGTQVGTTQFHSFQDFSVPTGNTAHFDSVLPTTNVIGRVTSSNISNIDGTLKTNGSTNLYLINPKGIIFGANAKLDIAGSFSASTANSIKFSDGSEFSATNPQDPPLLQVTIPLGLQYGESKVGATIKSSGSLSAGQDLVLNADKLDLAGQIDSQRDLKLQAQDSIRIISGKLASYNPYGGNVSIDIAAKTLELLDDSFLLTSRAFGLVNVENITINITDSIKLDRKSGVRSEGNVNIAAKTLELLGGSLLNTANVTDLESNAGDITINVADSVKFDGISGLASSVGSSGRGNGGNVNITTKNLELLGGSFLSNSNFGKGNAGDITINVADSVKFDGVSKVLSLVGIQAVGNGGNVNITAKTFELLGGSFLSNSNLGKGNAGDITINVADSVKFDGKSTVVAQMQGVGNSGNLNISAKTFELLGGSLLTNSTFGKGNAGNVTIIADDSIKFDGKSYVVSGVGFAAEGNGGNVNIAAKTLELLDSSFLVATTNGKGNAGNITINAKDKVEFSHLGGVFSGVETGGNGDAGIISITANSLSVIDGGRISARTIAQGNAGKIIIKVTDAILISGIANGFPSSVSSSVSVGGIGNAGNVTIEAKSIAIADSGVLVSSRTDGQGDAGNVNIKAETLNIQNGGGVSTSTSTDGNGGSVNIVLGEALFLDGNGSLITAGTTDTSTGKGGNIFIDPPLVSITNGAVISVNSLGKGNGGSLNIVADKFIFANKAALFANTASGEGGNINLKIGDIFFPRNNSNITATAGGTGNGGNISLSSLFMVAVPSENSDLFANAFFGKGGQIDITTNGLFGLGFRSRLTPLSDITASSEFGVQGTVSITTPGVDPSKGLSNLPTDTSDASRLVAEKCLADRQDSSFVITGRGGVPASPFDTISAVNIPDHLGSISNQTANNTANAITPRLANSSDRLPNQIPDRIVEAQGWIINTQGQISLIAEAAATPAPVWSNQPKCK
ncbi:MAG: filamentous hemagglutinin N-terminal domain-containing protein [Pseudanabaena sp. ELA645]